MRKETQSPYEICVYCKQPITEIIPPIRRLENGKAAHLQCYLDHMDDGENDVGR